MTEDLIARARRVTEAFNETVGRGVTEPSVADAELWAEAPLIVPMRAAVEGTEYSGKDALEDFARDSVATWETLRMDQDTYTQIGDDLVLGVGRLVGRARETGITVDNRLAFLFRFEGGRVAEFRTFTSEQDAREAAE
jgi:ketosteroid isomerase-like protein